ncbi:MAG: hypothetical protein KDC85_04280 [Saprospiraceae bacterium]|nr:hypothetical protein [Saprospiraceae bacterium]MCB9324100.1 hypothetical protein [Lewinellaceae bacterium]
MNFLEFLNYGAIGITLALAILSYRLLSKEQDQQQVREPMLGSIRNYMAFTLVIAVLFAITEFIAPLFSNDKTAEKVDNLWVNHVLRSEIKDSSFTIDQKIAQIGNLLNSNNSFTNSDHGPIDTSKLCEVIQDSLEHYKNELALCNNGGFYKQIDLLSETIDSYVKKGEGRSINISFEPEKKEDVFRSLIFIFSYLGEIRQGDGTKGEDGKPNTEKVKKIYARFKRSNYNLAAKDSITLQDYEDNKYHILKSDLAHMVLLKLKIDD